MFLYNNRNKDENTEKLITTFFQLVKNDIFQYIEPTTHSITEKTKFVVTVPAIWDVGQKSIMRKCLYESNIIKKLNYDHNMFEIVYEPEAAINFVVRSKEAAEIIKPDEPFMVFDAGGGTIDISFFKMNSKTKKLEQQGPSIGGPEGGVYVDEKFLKWVYSITVYSVTHPYEDFEKEFRKLNNSHTFMINWVSSKNSFEKDSNNLIIPFGGLVNEKLMELKENKKKYYRVNTQVIVIPREKVLKFFEKSVKKSTLHVEKLLLSNPEIKLIMCVGGYSISYVLYDALVKKFTKFEGIERRVVRPTGCEKAVLKGASYDQISFEWNNEIYETSRWVEKCLLTSFPLTQITSHSSHIILNVCEEGNKSMDYSEKFEFCIKNVPRNQKTSLPILFFLYKYDTKNKTFISNNCCLSFEVPPEHFHRFTLRLFLGRTEVYGYLDFNDKIIKTFTYFDEKTNPNFDYYVDYFKETSVNKESLKFMENMGYKPTEEIKQLLSQNDLSTLVNEKDETPLHLLFNMPNLLTKNNIEFLLKLKVNINAKNDENFTVLHIACKSKNIDLNIIQFLIDKKSNVNSIASVGKSSFHTSCFNENASLDLVKLLVENKANVNLRDAFDNIPLHYSCLNKKIDMNILKYLISQKSEINIKNKITFRIPLLNACGNSSSTLEIIDYLISQSDLKSIGNSFDFKSLIKGNIKLKEEIEKKHSTLEKFFEILKI